MSIALECETELARVDDADVWKEGRALRVWHYLKSGSPPAPGQSLQGVPEVVHAVPCAGESAFTTHVSRVQRQAAHTIGQLVSLRRRAVTFAPLMLSTVRTRCGMLVQKCA